MLIHQKSRFFRNSAVSWVLIHSMSAQATSGLSDRLFIQKISLEKAIKSAIASSTTP
ncbi:hypothetical protein ACL6C3_21150 [Capilliphycus salinus ALCB114379]|uniref:hypothetical protein n=1 Tax=Capilliphycus salinus TaxID=2768948 RepID=UPI0039A45292